jgi:hypothetical protein
MGMIFGEGIPETVTCGRRGPVGTRTDLTSSPTMERLARPGKGHSQANLFQVACYIFRCLEVNKLY